ncbi:hypothetical protein NC796_24365 [Aliifodinibius sp. S!AR15-10]|uniref:hypothetical protein n=1 Tax=Aliifodinibius sp. S!AR15-10 TaxID=2950437 RepID=UPI00285464BC|nr:hypothetical protein [Aliifodinibius sp. S!AR15-10]MDR8394305.1 hypothetical protein [Aliifodinibius sp. S!AR15-10]
MGNEATQFELNIANPSPLGYAALGTLLWVHGMIFSGIFPQAYGKLGEEVSTVFVICALLVAGIVAFLRNWTWDGTLFLYWSGLAAALFHLFLAWKAFKQKEGGLFRGLIASGFVVIGIGWALANWGMGPKNLLTGYVQHATALLCFWVCATELNIAGSGDSSK